MRFMYGRYGVDSLGKFLVALAFVTIILANITERGLFSMLSWFFLIYAYFRMFSRKVYKRAAENQAFLSKTSSSNLIDLSSSTIIILKILITGFPIK